MWTVNYSLRNTKEKGVWVISVYLSRIDIIHRLAQIEDLASLKGDNNSACISWGGGGGGGGGVQAKGP